MVASNKRPQEQGFVLVALVLSLAFVLGMAGMAVDIGRMYVTKSEAQSFVDSAALAAATQMDGTLDGLTRATATVANNPKRWAFGNNAFTSVTTSFATSASGPWLANPASASGYYFVQVNTTVTVPMSLIRVVAGPNAQVAASAVAGRSSLNGFIEGGEFPFSPYTRSGSPDNGADPFGFQIGNQYTLRWGAPGDRSTCGTDATSPNLSQQGDIRGYCCAGSASSIREAIVSATTDPVSIGEAVPMDDGAKNTEMTAIADRVNLDTDTTSTSYSQYLTAGNGNGERVVVVPVNNGSPSYTAVGFAGFFLLNASAYTGLGGNDSACAEYIGAWIKGVPQPQPQGSGAFQLKLYR